MRLAGKVAIITGGAHGMGESEALIFAREGATVVVADVDQAAGAQVAAIQEFELPSTGQLGEDQDGHSTRSFRVE